MIHAFYVNALKIAKILNKTKKTNSNANIHWRVILCNGMSHTRKSSVLLVLVPTKVSIRIIEYRIEILEFLRCF